MNKEYVNKLLTNSSFLFGRMIVVMAVSLFTSRLIIINLGVSNFGIFTYINNIIFLIGFLGTAMYSTSHRYFSRELLKSDNTLLLNIFNKIFSIQIVISFFIFLIIELLFFVLISKRYIIIEKSFFRSFILITLLSLNFITSFLIVPFSSLILSAEFNKFFAIFSLIESLFKLLIAHFISNIYSNKLLIYSFLIFCISIISLLLHYTYCRFKFSRLKLKFIWDTNFSNNVFKNFSWNAFSDLAYSLYGPGLSFLLGSFYGPITNASTGVAFQVIGSLNSVVKTFQTALNTQILKSFSINKMLFRNYIFNGSAISFFIVLLTTIPFYFETNWILNKWLIIIPKYSELFIKQLILIILVESFVGPLTSGATAINKLKLFHGISSIFIFLIFPVSLLALLLDLNIGYIFYIGLFFSTVAMISRTHCLSILLHLDYRYFYNNLFKNIITVFILSFLLCFLFHYFTLSLIDPLTRCFIYYSISVCVIWFFGIKKKEKIVLLKYIKSQKW